MILLAKIVPLFILPLGLALAIIVVGALLAGHPVLRYLPVAAAALLWVAAMPAFANFVERSWTGEFRSSAGSDLPEADAIVVLGGFIASPGGDIGQPDLGAAVDRVFRAARLYHAGNAPVVIASGGNLPWLADETPEAHLVRDVLGELGVPAGDVLIEPESRSTRENAINTAALLRERALGPVLLVTSARHMRRALATFAQVGVDAIAAPADFQSRSWRSGSVLAFLPDASALLRTSGVVREAFGLLVYRARGWA